MLDVPNFFWDSEPTLHPLYAAVREYLEIKPRIQVLNERCRVFLDLAEILSDSIADNKMSRKCCLSRSLFSMRGARGCGVSGALTCVCDGADLRGAKGLTWIIIVLILLSIFVTCTEVFLRFGLLAKRSKGGGVGACVCPGTDGLLDVERGL